MRNSLFLAIALQLVVNLLPAQTSTIFNASGTYVVPPGVTSVTVQAWGGGGVVTTGLNGAGGGAFVQSKPIVVTPGQSITVTVGTQGQASSFGNFISAQPGSGTNGGAQSFGDFILVSYRGGNGGVGATFFGGSYGGGGGGAGGSSGPGQNGTNAANFEPGRGGLGGTGGGNGGNGGRASGPGNGGTPPGGGKGGIGTAPSGSGRVIVTYDCSSANTPVLMGNDTTIAAGDNTPAQGDHTDFGETNFLGGFITRTFTIKNTGTHTLKIKSVQLTGNTLFKLQSPISNILLQPEQSINFQVRFTPLAAGTFSDEIVLHTDNCPTPVYKATIQGKGSCQPGGVPAVRFKTTDIADGDSSPSFADSTNFGDAGFNGYHTERTFSFHNTGTQPIRLDSIGIDGPDAGRFILQGSHQNIILAPGSSRNFTIRFAPLAAGPANAVINIHLENCGSGIYDFAITGNGVCNNSAAPVVKGNNTAINSGDISPVAEDFTHFGDVGYNGFSLTRNFVFVNPSPVAVTLSAINFSGAAANQFAVVSPALPLTVASGDSGIIAVRFRPTTPGLKDATINMVSTHCGNSTYTFALRGNGICDPAGNMKILGQNRVEITRDDITPDKADLTDYGQTGVGGFRVTRNFFIQNPSPGPITITAIGISGGAGNFLLSNTTIPFSVMGNQEAQFNIIYQPAAEGVHTATVTVQLNDLNSCGFNTFSFMVKGEATNALSVTFNSNGTYTPPIGVTAVIVRAWGAGASSSGLNGGGGGAFVQSKVLELQVNTGINVGIGQPQFSGTNNTFFGNFVTANSANGTTGGAQSTGTHVDYSYSGGPGGTGSSASFNRRGGGGGGAGGTNRAGQGGGNATSSVSGLGGSAGDGGGNGGNGAITQGDNGGIPGGGAGGSGFTGVAAQGGRGRVIINYICADAGTIGNAHSVPYPPQRTLDSIKNFDGVEPTTLNGLIYRWERSINNGQTWSAAPRSSNSLSYRFDLDSITQTTQYRRISNTACTTNQISNVVEIRVVNPTGVINGTVRSKNGDPVEGIKIYARKLSDLPGSPITWIDSAITGSNGTYSIQGIYFGDPGGDGNVNRVSTSFKVWAFKQGHRFEKDTMDVTLTNLQSTVNSIDFKDTTVYAITGRVFQRCIGCLNSLDQVTNTEGAVDSAEIYRENSLITRTGYIDSAFGRYAITVTDPKNYRIRPQFKNHQFTPFDSLVRVTQDVPNVNFMDTTTFSISGFFSAGCRDYIGRAELEFYDLLPPDPLGNPRSSEFRKRITTNEATGFYSIRLPARKYAVRVIAFSPAPGTDVQSPDLLQFFQVMIPLDSLTRDITTGNATLNLVYNRPPSIKITGLDATCPLPSPPNSFFAVMEQSIKRTFTVTVFQGPEAKQCPVVDTSLLIVTNIQKDDDEEVLQVKTNNGNATVTLTGGLPNIVAPFTKKLELKFNDIYNRNASLVRNVVVTGLKSNIGSFATVSPEVPIMILHDPPGDQSFSFWEKSRTIETATRFYAASSVDVNAWAQVKLGTEFSAGLGVSVETSVWGQVKGSVSVGSRINRAEEAVLSTTTTNNFSTASNEAVIGNQGDVYIGAALNLKYAITNEVSLQPGSCTPELSQKLMVANDGFATEYIYSEEHIVNTLIPTLEMFRDNPANTPDQTRNYANQIKVWQQTVNNNRLNKLRAPFDKNISFDGSAGPITSTTTSTASRTSTLEFDLTIASEVAAELGFEVGGSGVSGGVTVGFKMETGGGSSTTVLNSNTIGYTLDDDDIGDFYSVNIKKDPVYSTPVFETVAATTSCPWEPGTQPRDEFRFTTVESVKTNIPPAGEAEFILKIANTSQSLERRTYALSFNQASNPSGAVVTIGGSPALTPVFYPIDYLGEINVLVKVRRGAANQFSYEGLEFTVTDGCDGSISKSVKISAFFEPTCSPINLIQPEDGWIVNQGNQQILPVLFNGYTVAGTTSVALEYQRAGAINWTNGFTIPAASLNNSVNGTLVNWNVGNLQDGQYNLRMRLLCPTGIVTSTRSSGVIDRRAPVRIGKAEPTDDNFVRGDRISIEYNEPLDCAGVTPDDVEMIRLSNGQKIDVNVGCFQNRIVILPVPDISAWALDSVRVGVRNISDLYGNGKTTTDSWRFVIGSSAPPTGPRVLIVQANGSGTAGGATLQKNGLLSGAATVMEDGGIPLTFTFELPSNAPNDFLVNFAISGTAVFGKDFNIAYSQPQNLATSFNGATGSFTLRSGTKAITLSIIPIPNQQFEPDKTITLSILEGGDYIPGATTTATGIILNDDVPKQFIFTGSGNYDVPGNWDNGIVPPLTVLTGDEIIINPADGGECILNVPVTLQPGAKLTVMPGKVFRINSNLRVQKKL